MLGIIPPAPVLPASSHTEGKELSCCENRAQITPAKRKTYVLHAKEFLALTVLKDDSC